MASIKRPQIFSNIVCICYETWRNGMDFTFIKHKLNSSELFICYYIRPLNSKNVKIDTLDY